MKNTSAKLALITLLVLATSLPAQAGGRRHNYGNNNANAWGAAAVGAIVGVAIGSVIVGQQPPNYVYQQRNYIAQPQYFYAPQQACQFMQVPVYDQYGRIVQYRQVCQ